MLNCFPVSSLAPVTGETLSSSGEFHLPDPVHREDIDQQSCMHVSARDRCQRGAVGGDQQLNAKMQLVLYRFSDLSMQTLCSADPPRSINPDAVHINPLHRHIGAEEQKTYKPKNSGPWSKKYSEASFGVTSVRPARVRSVDASILGGRLLVLMSW